MTTRSDIMQRYVLAHEIYQHTRHEMLGLSGELIRDVCAAQRISCRQLAQQLEVSSSFLSKAARGVEPLSPELTRKILNLCGIDIPSMQSEEAA